MSDRTTKPFQQRVIEWNIHSFGVAVYADKIERSHRFFEEATELVQAGGCTAADAHALVDYVYSRPVGEVRQELGGVMITLSSLAGAHDLNMVTEGERELARVWTKVESLRAKRATKPDGSPLPGKAVA